jgi:tripartite-type tricarboxylate transporter receptor subunit TctC
MRCRQIFRFAAAAAILAFPQAGAALDYPTRPVRIIVGFAAGGVQDIIARLVAQPLSERLGQQFIVENRAGAGGNIAAEMVVKAPPDGYTLLMVGPPNEINATLYDNLNFNFIRDTAAVATIVRAPNVMEVNPAVPTKTVAEFIAYAKTGRARSTWRRPALERHNMRRANSSRRRHQQWDAIFCFGF